MRPGQTNALDMNTARENMQLRQAIGKLDVLPAMPVIAQKLLALKLDTEEGKRALLALIEEDPQISAKMLGLANSAATAASRNITTVRDAALLLGFKRIQSVATGIAVLSMMTQKRTGKLNMQDLWLHSLGIAYAMLSIARCMPENLRPSDDQIFLAGLLHDIGYLALAVLDPECSDRLHGRIAAEPQCPSLEIELEIAGLSHDELGAELGRHWGLPEEFIAALRHHHRPGACGTAGSPLARMIYIAEKLLHSTGFEKLSTEAATAEDWGALGIPPARAREAAALAEEQAEQAMQFAVAFS